MTTVWVTANNVSLKTRCEWGGVHPVGWERTYPTPSASRFWFVGSPWLSHLLIFCLHLHMSLCACLSMSGLHHSPSVQDYFMCPSLVGTATSKWRPCQPNPAWPCLNFIPLQILCFQTKLHFEVLSRQRYWKCPFSSEHRSLTDRGREDGLLSLAHG